jgi:hypothetical protein
MQHVPISCSFILSLTSFFVWNFLVRNCMSSVMWCDKCTLYLLYLLVLLAKAMKINLKESQHDYDRVLYIRLSSFLLLNSVISFLYSLLSKNRQVKWIINFFHLNNNQWNINYSLLSLILFFSLFYFPINQQKERSTGKGFKKKVINYWYASEMAHLIFKKLCISIRNIYSFLTDFSSLNF